jgi:hypothetical protein
MPSELLGSKRQKQWKAYVCQGGRNTSEKGITRELWDLPKDLKPLEGLYCGIM